MRVIGIDPGLRRMGWGVIESDGGRLRHIANGTCLSQGVALADRLLSLHGALTEIVAAISPTRPLWSRPLSIAMARRR